MNCSLHLIGDALSGDAMMLGYIERHLAAFGIEPERRYLCKKTEALFAAGPGNETEVQTVLIFCDPDQASLIAREIATDTGDTVTMRNDLLLPSRAVSVRTGYYKIIETAREIHVITVHTGHELPPPDLSGRTEETATVHIFDAEENTLPTVLRQIAEAYRVRYSLSEPIPGWRQCRLTAERFGNLEGAKQQLVTHFLTALCTDNIAASMIAALEASGKTVSFAESCTGGLLSYFLTRESGASNVFEGALVTYSNRLKSSWIAVANNTLEAYGAVSREVVEEMSAGALEVSGADYAVAVSGIAGPTGGTPQKPVGTVHVAVRSKDALRTSKLQLHGDRNYIQEQTVLHAVKMLMLLDKKTFFKFPSGIS